MNTSFSYRPLLTAVCVFVLFFSSSSYKISNNEKYRHPFSSQWKKCWGYKKWYGGCIEIVVTWSISNNNKENMQYLVDKIDVKLNNDESGLIFTFPPELKAATFKIQSKFQSAVKPGTAKKITVNPGSYVVPNNLAITPTKLEMHRPIIN